MSSVLYSLGRFAARARGLMLGLWMGLLAVLVAAAALFGQGANAPITIPGTESQDALTSLSHTFPQVSGVSASIIAVATDGSEVTQEPYKGAISAAEARLKKVPGVEAVRTPFSAQAPGGLAPDKHAALLTVQLSGAMSDVSEATKSKLIAETDSLGKELPEGAQVSYGGDVFSSNVPGLSVTEGIGVLVAFAVLLATLGSLLAAGMPLIIAIVGVGVSMAGILAATAIAPLNSTTPMLALMLGLAVGIDYTLFIVSRHQELLRAGVPLRESIARSTATSGSAVLFAGITVIIALVGLSVAGIPFLTALGIAAACAVALAVLISITLTPALLSFAGLRILPRKARKALRQGADGAQGAVTSAVPASAGDVAGTEQGTGRGATSAVPESAHPRRSLADRFFTGWVKAATRWPLVTVLAVIVALGAAAAPALQLRLALPNATSLPTEDPARVTYELTGKHFGEGYNGPLLLTGSIITSTDPLGLAESIKSEVERVPGVASVPLATPNPTADTLIVQVVPEHGPHSQSTTDLVNRLRELAPKWQSEHGVRLLVTGFTAVGIDVSAKLLAALVPFSIFVVGLSLVLLAMVFRSLWVPLKATLGYLLSVGVAFGAVVAVFQHGVAAGLLHVSSTGPVLSFMPIILMGVLFGLAMDYEVFLVARVREEWVHGADARTAIRSGFVGSAKVVTAAALIMFAVFAAFVPEGDPSIKVIAFGLAVGVFVDAFIVRMTLVPAVLALLGERAWRMPGWLARLLPSFDVEGEGLAREVSLAAWPADVPAAVLASSGVRVLAPGRRLSRQPRRAVELPDLRLRPGEALLLPPLAENSPLLAGAVSGRLRPVDGTLKSLGLLLPERSATVRARSAWCEHTTLRRALREKPALVVLDLRGLGEQAPSQAVATAAKQSLLAQEARGSMPVMIIIGTPEAALPLLPQSLRVVTPEECAPAQSEHGGSAVAGAADHHIRGPRTAQTTERMGDGNAVCA